jgi:tRNA (guanosine-2'-O-)-methyltransferase
MDELEEAMRVAGAHLDESQRLMAEAWEKSSWKPGKREAADRELLRRALDIPFLGDLVRIAWRLGPDADLSAPDFVGRDWHEGEAETSLLSADRRTREGDVAPIQPGESEPPPARLRAAERALAERSRSLVVVLDQLVGARNASAVVRTTEALGIQEVHFIDHQGKVGLERSVTKQAQRWLDLYWHRETAPAIQSLKARGYRILVSDIAPGALPLEEVPLSGKIAVAFGSEQKGVSDALRAQADGFFYMPSAGFTSYVNVSVMAGIALYALDRRMREAGLREKIDAAERDALRRVWYAALARGNMATARRYLGWLDDPPSPAGGIPRVDPDVSDPD